MHVSLLITDSFFGRCIYHLSGRKYFAHEDEKELRMRTKDEEQSTKTLDISSKVEGSDDSNIIIVDYESEDDPENPYNWSLFNKIAVSVELSLLQLAVYTSAGVYTPGVEELMEAFDTSYTLAMLPMTLFVFGYGTGTMLYSPLSEDPIIGRTNVYIVSTFLYFIFQVGIAASNNIATMCVLRFLAGFFGSPPLTILGASFVDIVTLPYTPLGLGLWGLVSFAGPSLGPLLGSVLVVKKNWRWCFWLMSIIAGITIVIMFFFLPETSASKILYRKADRLNKACGEDRYVVKNAKERHIKKDMIEMLWRPVTIALIEPIVLFISIYLAVVYAVLYLWFEALPLVFSEVYHFTTIEVGTTYISLIVGVCIGIIPYLIYLRSNFTNKLLNKEKVEPEVFLKMSIVGSFLMPLGLFIFGWSSTRDAHWIGPLIGAAIVGASEVINFQSLLNYLGMSFPRFVASVYASGNLIRSLGGGVFPLFGKSMYNNLATHKYPVAWGSSILGFISLAMCLIPIIFYKNGIRLRARSKYSG